MHPQGVSQTLRPPECLFGRPLLAQERKEDSRLSVNRSGWMHTGVKHVSSPCDGHTAGAASHVTVHLAYNGGMRAGGCMACRKLRPLTQHGFVIRAASQNAA